ncbi:MAG: hypothetical protein E6R14_08535 [Thermomicrobiales bacterium]|nr:MAG: hypothetical protein E6R14_08535 [Thermomicrobiales bacterium]
MESTITGASGKAECVCERVTLYAAINVTKSGVMGSSSLRSNRFAERRLGLGWESLISNVAGSKRSSLHVDKTLQPSGCEVIVHTRCQ